MPRFEDDDHARVDVSDEKDPDRREHHGHHGKAVAVVENDVVGVVVE